MPLQPKNFELDVTARERAITRFKEWLKETKERAKDRAINSFRIKSLCAWFLEEQEYQKAGLEFRVAKFAEIDRRLEQLEARTANLKYCGVWANGRIYQRGNFVTHNGSVWHCDAETQDKPGASNDWTLAVKSGKDAR